MGGKESGGGDCDWAAQGYIHGWTHISTESREPALSVHTHTHAQPAQANANCHLPTPHTHTQTQLIQFEFL